MTFVSLRHYSWTSEKTSGGQFFWHLWAWYIIRELTQKISEREFGLRKRDNTGDVRWTICIFEDRFRCRGIYEVIFVKFSCIYYVSFWYNRSIVFWRNKRDSGDKGVSHSRLRREPCVVGYHTSIVSLSQTTGRKFSIFSIYYSKPTKYSPMGPLQVDIMI